MNDSQKKKPSIDARELFDVVDSKTLERICVPETLEALPEEQRAILLEEVARHKAEREREALLAEAVTAALVAHRERGAELPRRITENLDLLEGAE